MGVADALVYISSNTEKVFACGHLAADDGTWETLMKPVEGFTRPQGVTEGSPADQFTDYVMASSDPESDRPDPESDPEWPFLKCVTNTYACPPSYRTAGRCTKKHIAATNGCPNASSAPVYKLLRDCHDPAVAQQEQEKLNNEDPDRPRTANPLVYVMALPSINRIFRRVLHTVEMAYHVYGASWCGVDVSPGATQKPAEIVAATRNRSEALEPSRTRRER
jgi:hypothetical protein